MIFNLSGKQIQLSPSFSTYAKFEIEKCIFKYYNNPISSNLKLSKIKHAYYINIVVYLNNKINNIKKQRFFIFKLEFFFGWNNITN